MVFENSYDIETEAGFPRFEEQWYTNFLSEISLINLVVQRHTWIKWTLNWPLNLVGNVLDNDSNFFFKFASNRIFSRLHYWCGIFFFLFSFFFRQLVGGWKGELLCSLGRLTAFWFSSKILFRQRIADYLALCSFVVVGVSYIFFQ